MPKSVEEFERLQSQPKTVETFETQRAVSKIASAVPSVSDPQFQIRPTVEKPSFWERAGEEAKGIGVGLLHTIARSMTEPSALVGPPKDLIGTIQSGQAMIDRYGPILGGALAGTLGSQEQRIKAPIAVGQHVMKMAKETPVQTGLDVLLALSPALRAAYKPTHIRSGATLFETVPPAIERPIVPASFTRRVLQTTVAPVKDVYQRLISPLENRLKSVPGRLLAGEMRNVHRKTGRRRGEFAVELEATGIRKLRRKQREQVSDYLAGDKSIKDPFVVGVAQSIKTLRDRMWFKARAKNVQVELPDGSTRPIGKAKDLPHYLREDIAKTAYNDINRAIQKAEKIAGKDASLGEIKNSLDKIAQKGMRSASGMPKTSLELAEYLVSEGYANSLSDALMAMHRQLHNQLFNPFGSLERARIIKWPAKFVEKDAYRVMQRYGAGFAKRISEIEQWGQRGQGAIRRLKEIEAVNPAEKEVAQRGLQILTGEIERIKTLPPSIRGLIDFFIDAEMITKVGAGPATISQIGQPAISFMAEAGVLRSAKALKTMFTHKGRQQIRSTGATTTAGGKRTMEMFFGHESRSILSKPREVATLAFGQANRGLAAHAASTYELFIKDLHRIASKGSGPRSKWAQNKLKQWGVDFAKPLNQKTLRESMFQAATDSQLQRNILRDPLWMNNPHVRWLGFLKRFTLRQYDFWLKNILSEVKHGNPMPLLRGALLAQPAGEGVEQIKEAMKWVISGEKGDKFGRLKLLNESLWKAVATNIGDVATMGVLSELYLKPLEYVEDPKNVDNFTAQYARSFIKTLEFVFMPVAISEEEK
jgi:hypothetical protein